MAKGYEQNKARIDAVNGLGKELVRRSSARCELCGIGHEKLMVCEVPPLPETPRPDHSVLVCQACREGMEGGRIDPSRWHFLPALIWSEIPAVQVAAVRVCRKLQQEGVSWAGESLENLYLSPEIEEWLG